MTIIYLSAARSQSGKTVLASEICHALTTRGIRHSRGEILDDDDASSSPGTMRLPLDSVLTCTAEQIGDAFRSLEECRVFVLEVPSPVGRRLADWARNIRLGEILAEARPKHRLVVCLVQAPAECENDDRYLARLTACLAESQTQWFLADAPHLPGRQEAKPSPKDVIRMVLPKVAPPILAECRHLGVCLAGLASHPSVHLLSRTRARLFSASYLKALTPLLRTVS